MRSLLVALVALLCASCTLPSTARRWNGRVGPNGKPVYLKSTTHVGLNFGIILPFVGHTSISSMVDQVTAHIAEEKGDHVRVVETSSENYWYGIPPLTWIFTPIVTRVTAEYEPDIQVQLIDKARLGER